MDFVSFNGSYFPATQALLTVDNRSFKWGEGLFETMRARKGVLHLPELHLERLHLGLRLLDIPPDDVPSQEDLAHQVLELCRLNACLPHARIRLALFRGEEGNANYVLQAAALPPDYLSFNTTGYLIDIYPYARKSMDALSNLKTASHLVYVLASEYARKKELQEVLVLNAAGRIADAARANLFLLKNDEVYTPSLSEGGVAGVMRRYLMDCFKKDRWIVHQKEITQEDLEQADEVFLTNALHGIRWVESFRDTKYGNAVTASFYQTYLSTF